MFIAILQLSLFFGVTLSYGAIWLKIKRTIHLIGSNSTRYHNSAKLMMIFVVVFLFQWWPVTVFYIWSFIDAPPAELTVVSGFITNMGGVYNCIAYTVIRRRLQRQAAAQERVVVMGASSPSSKATSSSSINLPIAVIKTDDETASRSVFRKIANVFRKVQSRSLVLATSSLQQLAVDIRSSFADAKK